MPILSACALKGGVGKTTLIHHLAGALAETGRRVLCVDNDAQASLSAGIFGPAAVEALAPGETIAALYAGLDPLPADVIRPSGIPGLDVLPGSMAAAQFNHPRPDLRPAAEQAVLRDFLGEVRGRYDLILVDNPPNLQAANWAALAASDALFVPVVPEDYGSASLTPVLGCLASARAAINPGLALAGLVLTMVQPRLAVHAAYEEALRAGHGAGVLATRVPMAAPIKEAIAHRRPITHHKPRSAPARVFRALAAELLARLDRPAEPAEAA